MKIIFITGVSGAGKTAIVSQLEDDMKSNEVEFLYFDSVGIPSEEEMIQGYGSSEAWQEHITFEWIKHILDNYNDKQLVIIEGQVNIEFILEAFIFYNVEDYEIILINSPNEERHHRLLYNKKQAELINPQMDNWSLFLLNQAQNYTIPVLENNNSLEQAVEKLKTMI